MSRALFALILLPLILGLTLTTGCSSSRTSSSEPSADSTETATVDKAAPQDCTYKTTPLSAPTQVQIDCSNGTSFVVRKRADGKWEEEARSVAGARPSYASVEQAAKSLCCR